MFDQRFIDNSKGKKIVDTEWCEEDKYWTFIFEDGSELSFRLMKDIVANQ